MGQLILPSSSLVYVDTSPVIYSVEWNPNYFSLLQPLWLKLQAGEIEVVSSELILMETLVVPLRNADTFFDECLRRIVIVRRNATNSY